MNFIIKTLSVVSLIIVAVSCDRPVCKNTNTQLDKYSPDTKEYKDELVALLSKVDKSKLTYWVDTYQEHTNAQNIYAHIQGDGLCAKIVLNIKDSHKGIEELLKNKGVGYSGSELKGLVFDTKQDSISTEFVFQEIRYIVD